MSKDYYDGLAPYYRLLYADWEKSVKRQASALDAVIRECFGADARQVLDAACGIGTQCIGLAQLGYVVSASDLSPREVERARAEVSKRGMSIEFRVANMRNVWDTWQREFDVVIACDNAVPHLLSDADILVAFEQFHRCAKKGGGCVISVRDYANMERGGTKQCPRLTHKTSDGRIVLFDVWEFDGDFYALTTYVVEDNGPSGVQTRAIRGGRYYCVSIATLEKLFQQAGFTDVRTVRDRFFQPLVIARRS